MSANNWTDCPKCKVVKAKALEDAEAKLKKQYGKIPANRYEKELSLLKRGLLNEQDENEDDEENLREDWERGITSDGKVYVRYRAMCQKCNFVYNHKHEEQIDFFKNGR